MNSMRAMLVLTLLPGFLAAQDFFVDNQSGSDANDGRSAERAFATLAKATERLRPGDTLHLKPGKIYRESIVISGSGTAEKPIVVNGHGAVLSGLAPVPAAAWQSLGKDLYFFKYENSIGTPLLTRGPYKDRILNAYRSRPEDLRGGEALRRHRQGFYFRAEPGKTPADYDIHGTLERGAIFHSGVYMNNKDFITVENLTCESFANDGYNVHNFSHGLVFRNIAAAYNGDDGFSVHEAVQASVYHGNFHHNEFGIQDVHASQTQFFDCEVTSNRTCGIDLWGGMRILNRVTVSGNRCGQIRIRGGKADHIGLNDDDPLTRGLAYLTDVTVNGGGGQGLLVEPRAAVTARNLRIRDVDQGLVIDGELYALGLEVGGSRQRDYDIDRARAFDIRDSKGKKVAGKGQQIPLGENEYDYLVYRPDQEFDSRAYGNIHRRGDAYNDHFQVIWDASRRLFYAFWTQASWEGASDSHICFSKSADKGRTWTKPVILAGSETRQYPRQDAYYQQPMLSKSGRLYCLWTERLTHHGMVGSFSDDAGETWERPRVMNVRRMDQDPTDYRRSPNYINWQRPLRLGRNGRYFVGSSHHGKAPYDEKEGCKIEFWEFLNLDDNPTVDAIRLDYFATNRQALGVDKLPKDGNYFVPKFYPGRNPPVPEGPAVEEAAIVKLPDGRLFALMRASVGSPVWSQSRDDGRTWSGLKVLKDANGKPFPHPRSPCPIYDRGGDAAASGEYFAFIHNTFDFKSQTACQPRPQLYLIAGKFDPDGEQPIRFSAPKLFLKRSFGNSLYSSYTVADGEGILWFPDVKYYLLGRKLGAEWFK